MWAVTYVGQKAHSSFKETSLKHWYNFFYVFQFPYMSTIALRMRVVLVLNGQLRDNKTNSFSYTVGKRSATRRDLQHA